MPPLNEVVELAGGLHPIAGRLRLRASQVCQGMDGRPAVSVMVQEGAEVNYIAACIPAKVKEKIVIDYEGVLVGSAGAQRRHTSVAGLGDGKTMTAGILHTGQAGFYDWNSIRHGYHPQ